MEFLKSQRNLNTRGARKVLQINSNKTAQVKMENLMELLGKRNEIKKRNKNLINVAKNPKRQGTKNPVVRMDLLKRPEMNPNRVR